MITSEKILKCDMIIAEYLNDMNMITTIDTKTL